LGIASLEAQMMQLLASVVGGESPANRRPNTT